MSTCSSLWLLAVLLLLQVQVDLSEANRFAWSAALRPVVWQSSWESHLPQASRDASNAATDSDAATADGLTLAAVARYSSRHDQDHLRKTSSAHLWRRKSRLRNIDESDEECYQGYSSEPCSRVATVPRARAAAAAFSPSSPAQQPKIKQSSARGNSSPTASRVTALPASAHRPLNFWENMFCGAISRSLAQTIMHPANTMKTMLQSSKSQSMADLLQPRQLQRLTSGAGANLLLSIPSGAVNFAVLELVRKQLDKLVESNDDDDDDRKGKGKSRNGSKRKALLGPSLDFLSSSISTIACSVVSTPQMVITDNIMAGNYPNLPAAIQGLGANGIVGFYRGWWPGLVGKIPSYALTWTLFQQLKEVRTHLTQRPAKDWENAFMGCLASGTTVSIMIPMDTIKTRLVTQMSNAPNAYKGIVDCAVRVAKEEGIGAFYRGLPPRLVSVVPMIGIQFGVYEFMRRTLRERKVSEALRQEEEESENGEAYGRVAVFEEALMEVAASSDDPNPAPRISVRIAIKKKKKSRQAKNWLKQRR